MEKTPAPSNPAQPAPFYVKKIDDQTFNFRRPGLDLVDSFFMGTNRKGPARAAAAFTEKLVTEDSRGAWEERVKDEPGLMTEVAQEILDRLGFK